MTKTLISLAILASFLLALAGCGTGEASISPTADEKSSGAVPVEVTAPWRQDLYASYAVTATIGSEGDAPVLARVAGEVVELFVEEGAIVKQGQPLARLDGERLRLEMLAARADLEKARGELDRHTDLNRRGLVSEAMYEGLRYDVAELQATYALKKLDYEYSTIRATIDGVVSERLVKLGETLSAGTETFRITDTGELIAYLQIPQDELGKFENGHAAVLTVDAMPGMQFDAEIIRISPTIDVSNGTFRATAFIDNERGLLAPGMFARFSVNYEKHPAALTIPVTALLGDEDEAAVYVVEDGEAARRPVRTGIVSGDVVEVLDGLLETDRIIIVGQGAVREGGKVLAMQSDRASIAG